MQPGFYHAEGKVKGKIGVLIESHYDETEFRVFNAYFPSQGFEVEYISNLWGNGQLIFTGNDMTSQVAVQVDVSARKPTDYDGIILIGGYAMDRLRYEANPVQGQSNQAPAVQFLREAVKVMDEGKVFVGTICHSLWLFCADPALLRGRRVTCSHNILYDVQNAGATVVFDGNQTSELIQEGHFITGKHPEVVSEFVEKFASSILKQEGRVITP
ncbi:DJ-1/PfpI family protein [Paenibacillus agilis]|uniref:Thiamine biosynthesis protein ThiJ n=1 Tax=Paenibacillus agilis TaxID=3020863 RepID=A0A559J155_9BACL|nr:DJ-1/PfpI family protein [Paenibacillus agilis]TVX93583.1 thiamine biosynthesis protein ThiJ [Paenibacillus agilis]